jgi:uncharacterized protein YuzE
MESRYHYDEEVDDLIISNRMVEEKVDKNYMFDDFVISVTNKGKILGLEIRNISRLLKEYGINPEILERFKGVELIVTPKKDFIAITISFEIPEETHIIERKIPITHLPIEITS